MLTAMPLGKLAALLTGALLFTGCQTEQGPFPSRELKLIVQASPGGLSDSVSRIMASLSESELGVPIVCENKPGASGALAFSYVTRRPPDGYTLGHAPVEIAMVRSLGYADIGPDDMDLICLVQKSPPVLVVRSDAPWKSFDEFLGAARERPGGLIMANSGTGSIWHFNTLLMEKYADFRVTHVPYSGSSGSLASLLGGHVDAVISGAGEAVANVEAGRLRPLIVLAEDRSQLYPGCADHPRARLSFWRAGLGRVFRLERHPARREDPIAECVSQGLRQPAVEKALQGKGHGAGLSQQRRVPRVCTGTGSVLQRGDSEVADHGPLRIQGWFMAP